MLVLRGSRTFCWQFLLLLLAACSNGRGSLQEQEQSSPPPPPTPGASESFSIGGTVSGLNGSGLVLQNNGAGNVSIGGNGAFTFDERLASGATYNVTVLTQPSSPAQTCTVTNGSGTASGNVQNVTVTCAAAGAKFSIGGTVSGLAGSGLALSLNGIEDLAIASNGAFTFGARMDAGASYNVAIRTQPSNPAQVCTLARGSGTVGGDVTTVRVSCAGETFSVGGSVNGLLGSGLVLRNNGEDEVAVDSNGSFVFPRRLASGATYNVTVHRQPSGPAQTCAVSKSRGTIETSNVTSVVVSCNTSDFTIGGTVTGLGGSGLVLSNNGTDEVTLDENGRFEFPTGLPSGASYHVTIARQPTNPAQTCSISGGSGVVHSSNVTDVAVACATQGFTVGGRVSGLEGSGLVLQNNGADNLEIASNGRFTFPTPLARGTPYNVTVAGQPRGPQQRCDVEHGSGSIDDSNVRDVRVRCDDD